MRTDRCGARGRGGRWGGLALALGLAAPHAAWAQSGFVQGRYEQVEAQVLVPRPGGFYAESTFTLSYWTQNHQLQQSSLWGPNLNVAWQLGFQDRQAIDRADRFQVPYGNLRLTLPTSGFYASVQPATTTSLLGTPGFGVDSLEAIRVRQRTTQAVVTGYVALPSYPRLDVSWIRDQRDPSLLGPRRVDDRRDLRLSHQLGRISMRGNYGDLGTGGEGSGVRPFQRYYGGGAGLLLDPAAGMSLQLDYDFSGFDRGDPGNLKSEARTHRATTNGSWHQSRTVSWNLFGNYVRSENLRLGGLATDAAEGQLTATFQPRQAFRLQGGLQGRKVDRLDEAGAEGVALASAVLQGAIRQGWSGLVDLTQTVTSGSFRSPYATTTLRANSGARLREGIDATVDLQVGGNNDTLVSARAVSQGNVGLRLRPLRTLQTSVRAGVYRIGPSFLDLANESRSAWIDMRWTPLQSFELQGSLRRQQSRFGSDVGSTTRTAFARWRAGAVLQLDLDYSRTSTEAPAAVGLTPLRDREIVGMQAIWNLDRVRQLTGQANLVNPNTAREIRAYNASFTWRFGR